MRKRVFLAGVAALALIGAACGGSSQASGGGSDGALTGSIFISGSSTVEPISSLVAELFSEENPDVELTVEGPGTGDGFELFCNGETDISDASRPIEAEEIKACKQNGIEFVELKVAIDGLSILTSPNNDVVTCLSFADLYALVGPEAEGIDNWNGAETLAKELGSTTDLPDAPLAVSGPGEESGTYDYIAEEVIGAFAEDRGLVARQALFQVESDVRGHVLPHPLGEDLPDRVGIRDHHEGRLTGQRDREALAVAGAAALHEGGRAMPPAQPLEEDRHTRPGRQRHAGFVPASGRQLCDVRHTLRTCKPGCSSPAGEGNGRRMTTRRLGPAQGNMDTARRGNYESGSDYVLEYGELRFTFNERDFTERVEQAATKLGFVSAPLGDDERDRLRAAFLRDVRARVRELADRGARLLSPLM
jgi:hypothetical protein